MVAVRRVVDPVFQMVLVAALMVQPGGAVALGLALGVVGAARPLPVFGPGPELHGGQLAYIVGQALPVQPAAETIFHHQHFVMADRFVVFNGMPQGLFSSPGS